MIDDDNKPGSAGERLPGSIVVDDNNLSRAVSALERAGREVNGAMEMRRAFERLVPLAVAAFETLLQNPETPPAIKLAAAREIADRIIGKSLVQVQTVNVVGQFASTIERVTEQRLSRVSERVSAPETPRKNHVSGAAGITFEGKPEKA